MNKESSSLTSQQKERLLRLEAQLKVSYRKRDYSAAKVIVLDIQDLLRPLKQLTRLAKNKNLLFELAIEVGEYDSAEIGFMGIRQMVHRNTRIYLEATALLAICYLRKNDYEKAKPFIQEVLRNEKVIKSEKTRHLFHHAIIQRFDEEAALFSLKIERTEQLDIDQIDEEAALLMAKNNEDCIYLYLGKSLPKQTKDILFQIDEFAKNQLGSSERKMLPSPKEMIKDETVGKTVFHSLKRVIYNSLCDPNSEVYKAWYTNGMAVVLNKKYITAAVYLSLSGLGLGFKALVVSAIALIIRLGLDVYCQHYKPNGIMELRMK